MTADRWFVTFAAIALIAFIVWFFWMKRSKGFRANETTGGYQEAMILVKGGYTPDTIVVQAGKPVRLQFYRDETADCSERVVFEQFGIDQQLPPFQTTAIEFTPDKPGEYPFRCGMNMLKGLLVVEPAGERRAAPSPHKFHGVAA